MMNIFTEETRIESSQFDEDKLISSYNKCINFTRIFYIIYGLLSLHQFFFWKTNLIVFCIYLFLLAFWCFVLLLCKKYIDVNINDNFYYGLSILIGGFHIIIMLICSFEIFTKVSNIFLMYVPSLCLASMIIGVYILNKYSKYKIPLPDFLMEKIEHKQNIIIPLYVCLTLILYYLGFYLQGYVNNSKMLRYMACNTFTPIVIYLCYINYSNRNRSKNFLISILLLIIYTTSSLEQNHIFDKCFIVAN